MKVIVFDLGGTLMKYVGMSLSWADYYEQGFLEMDRAYNCGASCCAIERSIEIFKKYNPRLNYREIEYSPEYIFAKALDGWDINVPVSECVKVFWQALDLKAQVFPDTIPVLQKLRENGYTIAALTDLPSAFPDVMFKSDIIDILPYIDYYVSSAVCGYRKPNRKGLSMIAEKYGVAMEELIFVGDEEKDKRTALNAGCRFIRIDRTGARKEYPADLYKVIELI